MKRVVQVAAFDGGVAHMGAVRALVNDRAEVEVTHATVFITDRGAAVGRGKKKLGGITLSADNRRRAQEISKQVRTFLYPLCEDATEATDVDMVVVEAFSPPPDASSGVQLAMSLGVVYAWCEWFNIPMCEVAPGTIKAVLGVERGLAKSESKKAVRDAVDARLYPDLGTTLAGLFLTDQPKDVHEHPYDAAGAIIAAVEHDRFRAVLTLTV